MKIVRAGWSLLVPRRSLAVAPRRPRRSARCGREPAARRVRIAHPERPRAPDQDPRRRGPVRAARRAGHPAAGERQLGVAPVLVESRRAAIDSVANADGVSRPGLALVTFFGQRTNARFDPQTLTVMARSREFRPLGIVPFSGRFTSQQLDVREQVSGIYPLRGGPAGQRLVHLPVRGTYSDDWQGKQRMLDRERARVAPRERASVRRHDDELVGRSRLAAPTRRRRAARADCRAMADASKGHAPRVPLRRVQTG